MRDRFKGRKKLIEIIRAGRGDKSGPARVELPDDYFHSCNDCGQVLVGEALENFNYTCYKCSHHMRMPRLKRLELLFHENYKLMEPERDNENKLDFPDYEDRLQRDRDATGFQEAVSWGRGKIGNEDLVFFTLDPNFIMGSMGEYVGEEITKAIEYAGQANLPLLGISASGGARMQEGIFSLFQMAKTLGALKRFQSQGGLFISLLTDPTFGGVTASFALLGDINIAEPKALIGFAGPRVIRETIGQELPAGFQSAEFLVEKGFVDIILARNEQAETIEKLINLHTREVSI